MEKSKEYLIINVVAVVCVSALTLVLFMVCIVKDSRTIEPKRINSSEYAHKERWHEMKEVVAIAYDTGLICGLELQDEDKCIEIFNNRSEELINLPKRKE